MILEIEAMAKRMIESFFENLPKVMAEVVDDYTHNVSLKPPPQATIDELFEVIFQKALDASTD